MTRFSIVLTPTAERQLRSLHGSVSKRIIEKLEQIRDDPARFVKRLQSSPYYSLRAGDYRAILGLQLDVWVILVIKVGHRRHVYER